MVQLHDKFMIIPETTPCRIGNCKDRSCCKVGFMGLTCSCTANHDNPNMHNKIVWMKFTSRFIYSDTDTTYCINPYLYAKFHGHFKPQDMYAATNPTGLVDFQDTQYVSYHHNDLDLYFHEEVAAVMHRLDNARPTKEDSTLINWIFRSPSQATVEEAMHWGHD